MEQREQAAAAEGTRGSGDACQCSPRSTVDVRVTRSGGVSELDQVVSEEPLEIRLNGRPLAVTLRTPGHDEELALGFLVAEQIVSAAEDVRSSRQLDAHRFEVELSAEALDRWAQRRVEREFRITSACGACGRPRLEDLEREIPAVGAPAPELSLVCALPARLRAEQRLFAATGGSHAAGVFSYDGELVCAFEDIGRHNAVDKAIGSCFIDGLIPLERTVLMVSGRAGFELAEKAAIAGAPVLAAVGAASSMAVEVAARTGLKIYAFVRGDGATRIGSEHQTG